MSLRARVLGVLDVLLRVPPLFVIDEILKIGVGLSDFQDLDQDDLPNLIAKYRSENPSASSAVYNNTTETSPFSVDIFTYSFIALSLLRLILSIAGNKYVPIFLSFDKVVNSCFGNTLADDNWNKAILDFKDNLDESKIPHTPKIHALIYHVPEFINENKMALSFFSEQASEQVHHAFGCLIAICVFVLNSKQLVVVYMYLMSLGIIGISYWTNENTVKIVTMHIREQNVTLNYVDIFHNFNLKELLEERGWLYSVLENYILQTIMAFLFVNIHLGPRYSTVQRLLPVSFMIPSIFLLIPMAQSIQIVTPLMAALLPLALIKFVLWSSIVAIIQSLYTGYREAKEFISNFGISALVENEWHRLNVPEVLRSFWVLRTFEYAAIFFISGYWTIEDQYSPEFRLIKYLLVTGCETLTAVLGLTSVVSYICNYIGKFFQWILLTEDENDKNFGTVSAIVFYILALQTGLTGLEPELRFVRLCRNFCLLFTALLHFTHNILNPLLMSLSASHNPSLRRHLHALFVCTALVTLSFSLMYILWLTQETSTWLLAVTAFSIEVIVKVFVSLAIYCLFLYDAKRETFWEKLDDYIYYIRSFGNTVEFCFGIFLFFNGAWILLFESGSAIRAVMMCIHAYFNIWCDAKAGWSVFMKRRTAVNKIESLPEATEEQLANLNDVCAICYQEMLSAKITKCKHFFHGVCLRKWLYVQDRCPLCHDILHLIDTEDKKSPTVVEQNELHQELLDAQEDDR